MNTPSTPQRTEQLAGFYTAHADRLKRLVWHRANVSHEILDDACFTAWTTLMRRPDVTLDERGLNWLTVVATHEAWRLKKTPERPVDGRAFDQMPDDDGSENPTEERVLDRLEHEHRVQALAALKPREREALVLKALGYGYDEIAQLTNSTYTAVNRRIAEGRAALRRRPG